MNPIRPSLIVTALLTLAACGDAPPPATAPAAQAPAAAADTTPARAFAYPAAATGDTYDEYFGERVYDPYRWMEDLDAPGLAPWIEGQNKLVADYVAAVPSRDQIRDKLTTLWNYERYGIPQVRGERYFYTRNDGLQNQAPVYWQQGLEGEPKLLLDPNALAADGTMSLAAWEVSEDGRHIAYAVSDGGSDWRTIHVREVDTGNEVGSPIRWAKFTGITWRKDGSGFYYSRYDAPPEGADELKVVNKFQKLYFHALGTEQAADQLVYERISVSLGTDERNLVFVKDLTKPDAPARELVAEFRSAWDFIGARGDTLYFRTDDAAERYRIVAADLGDEGFAPREVIAQRDATIVSADLAGDLIIVNQLKDAYSRVDTFGLDGKPRRSIELPGIGTANGFDGGVDSTAVFYAYSGFTTPGTIWRYELATGRQSVFREPKVAFDPDAYETTQVFYTSKDGTRVPMFITARKGAVRDGSLPTILYGYGGFNIPVTPTFSATNLAWLEMGGVYAVANLRGGGEYGRAWHEGATRTNRPRAFEDFAAAAEFLIAEKWTSPAKLAISGRSNGGLLVAATMLQRPELFGAALPAVGVLDMLRFREFTIGWAWESDYGSVKNEEEFRALLGYSPLHNIKRGVEYPATLITTADRDDRVFPAHSFKFAAALQNAYQGERPMLIRVETRAGHGAGKPTSKIIEENTDIYAFLVRALEMQPTL